MNQKKILLFFAVLFLNVFIFKGQNANRKFIKLEKNFDFVKIETNDGWYQIKPYSNEIFETSFIPKGQQFIAQSDAVVLKPQKIKFRIKENKNEINLRTKGLTAIINKNPFQITYYYLGKELISERKGYQKTKDYEIIDFNLDASEVLYGGGERVLGMNRRGYKLQLYNRADYGYETHSELMNYCIPLVYSSKKYAVFFDNAPKGYLDLDSKKDNSMRYETINGRKTYHIIAGNSWEQLVGNYVSLTGKQPLIPRWALGNFSSRFGYHSQKEVEQTIQKFEDEKIPVDAIVLDLYWFGKTVKGTMGNLAFYKDSFPNPKKMIAKLASKNIKTVLVTEPFILTTSNRWKEAVQKDVLAKTKEGKPFTYDFYFGHTGLIDIFNNKASGWFWNIYKNLVTDYGVAGWWGDLGEPEVHPAALQHINGTADEVHNIYGHYWAKTIAQGYQRDFPNKRLFLLMRAGYAGSQHYGLIPWSGDVNRTWGGFKGQPEIALQMGMQGLAFAHSDLGGFAGANLDDELYERWLQYGVFQPIFRPHAQEQVPSEPVFRSEKAKQIAKEAINLRYKLMPYNYTLAFINHTKGLPLMRPLFFEEQHKKNINSYDKAYLWGKSFLISPVLEPEIMNQSIYFPVNNNWFDYYTDEMVKGGTTKTVRLEKNRIPTYVRAGSFIPSIKPIQNVASYSLKAFQLDYYFDKSITKSEDILYNDDGESRKAFEKGKYEMIQFKSNFKNNCLTISINPKIGQNFIPESKNITLIIHHIKEPIQIKNYEYKYDTNKKTLTILIQKVTNQNKIVKIKI
ncbi:MAG: TIM-barrel domain-containing protein [Lutibacter sp.]